AHRVEADALARPARGRRGAAAHGDVGRRAAPPGRARRARRDGGGLMRFDGFRPYVPVRLRRLRTRREMERLRKRGPDVAPVVVEGRAIAKTFWGQSWCRNLERYSDYANRLPRGRTYVRSGSVVDLQIASGEVTARVAGSQLYTVRVRVSVLPKVLWAALCDDCAGGIDSLVELLQGRLSGGVMA